MRHNISSELVAVLRRRRWPVACVWVVVTLSGVAWAWHSPKIYQSASKLFVRLGRENVTLDPTVTLGQGALSAAPQVREQEINTIVETLRSRALLEQVVDRLTPEAIQRDRRSWLDAWLPEANLSRADAVDALAGACDAMAVRRSNLVSVVCEAHDPLLAKNVADALIDCFFDYHRGLNRNPGAGRFFAEQAKLLGDQLKQSEAALVQLKNSLGVVTVEDQKRLLLAQFDALQQDAQTTDAESLQAAAAIETLQAQLAALPELLAVERTEGHANTARDTMRDRLFGLEVRESELSARMTDDHFQLREARAQVAAARAIQRQEKDSRSQSKHGRNPAYEQAESSLLTKQADLAALQARAGSRREQLDAAARRLSALNEAEGRLAQLERESKLERESYEHYRQSLEQTRIDDALEVGRISNISVAEPPTTPRKAARPNRSLIVLLSMISATVAALAVGLVAEHFGGAASEPRASPSLEPRNAELDRLPATQPQPASLRNGR